MYLHYVNIALEGNTIKPLLKQQASMKQDFERGGAAR